MPMGDPMVNGYNPNGTPNFGRTNSTLTRFAAGLQNFVKTPSPLSNETLAQQSFPHHTFVVVDKGKWIVARQHTLIINPQEVSVQEPVRAQVIQTIGGAYVDDFGRGLPTVSIQGHTGWRLKARPDGTGLQDGWQAFKALRDDIFRYYTDYQAGTRKYLHNPNIELRWYDWAKGEYYIIQPTNFMLQQSVSQPLYFQYTFEFTCLQSITGGTLTIAKAAGSSGHTPVGSSTVKVDVTNLQALAQIMAH